MTEQNPQFPLLLNINNQYFSKKHSHIHMNIIIKVPAQNLPQNQIITVSGPRRIFTPRPVTQRANRPHTVRLGRIGQFAWLMVDNLQNVSSKSPGHLSQLNTRSLLYLGKLKLWHETTSTHIVNGKMHT
jgi:hypothetical protein